MSTNTTTPDPGAWVSVADAAARLGLHPRTVERRIAAGTMRSRKVDGGRTEVLIAGASVEAGAHPVEVREAEPDRQLMLGLTAVRAMQTSAVESRAELSAARRRAAAGWAVAAIATLGGASGGVWSAWRWASDLRAGDLAVAEARVEARVAAGIAEQLAADLERERTRLADLGRQLAAADERISSLADALVEAHHRGDALREALAAAGQDAGHAGRDPRHDAGQRPARWLSWIADLGVWNAGARHAPGTAPGVEEGGSVAYETIGESVE